MDVKQSRVLTVTLNDDDLRTLKKELSEIDEIWNHPVVELKACYWTESSVIGTLWDVSRTVEK